MRCIGFAFNFNIQRCEVDVGQEAPIVQQGYKPLLNSLIDYGIKSNFYISGYTAKEILQFDPLLIDTLRRYKDSLFNIGSYTYTHPIPQLLSKPELVRQIQAGLDIDLAVFGVQSKGFFPPEFAFTKTLAQTLLDCGLDYIIVLSSLLQKKHPELSMEELYCPYRIAVDDQRSIIAVPIALDLPDDGRRFFKRMLLGEISPQKAAAMLFNFMEDKENIFVILERDGETLYIDELNSGIQGGKKRLDEFLSIVLKAASKHDVKITNIEDYLQTRSVQNFFSPDEQLGNTAIETFTSGPSKEIWDLTQAAQKRLLRYENIPVAVAQKAILEKAWEHMLLAHNSDGRIGYWHSDWQPGEHVTVQSRKDFVRDHLMQALNFVDRLENS